MDVSVVENENENNITYDEKDDNKTEFLVQSDPIEEDSSIIDEDDSFSYSDSDSDLYDESALIFRYTHSEDYKNFSIEDDIVDEEEALQSFAEARHMKLAKKLQLYRMEILRLMLTIENLSDRYYFKRELDLHRLEKMKQNEEKDRMRREKRSERVKKIKKYEEKLIEKLENEKRRMMMKETPKVIDYSEMGEEPVEKTRKRRRSSKKDENGNNKSPKISVKPAPVALQPLQTCEYKGCDETSLPLSKYCFCHILNDKDQVLFEKCQYEDPVTGKGCDYPIIKFSSPSLCQAHIDISNKGNEDKKRKADKSIDRNNDKTQRVKNENKKETMNRNIEPQMLNRMPEEGMIAPHPGLFVFHNEHQTGTGIQPPYIIQHPIITQLGPIPMVNNPNPNFMRYGNGFYEFLPPQQQKDCIYQPK